MLTRIPEAQILEELHLFKSKPGEFQTFAEEFLFLKNREKYTFLRPNGRNVLQQTVKGYPDAFFRNADGNFMVVEATVGEWSKHIASSDVPKINQINATKGGRVVEYWLFCLDTSPKLLAQENAAASNATQAEENAINDLISTGLNRSQVHIIFADELAKSLSFDPQYARLLQRLGFNLDSHPWHAITDVPLHGLKEFTPTAEEYASGSVVPHAQVEELNKRLSKNRVVLIQGLGAAGKTSLSIAFGYNWMNAGKGMASYLDCMSLDFSTDQDLRSAQESLRALGSEGNVFIVDNCHVASNSFMSRLMKTWATQSRQSKLLLLRRPRRSAGSNDPLSSYINPKDVISRTVGTDDLLCLYQRLAHRRWKASTYPKPDKCTLHEWLRVGGDLVAFGLAIYPGIQNLKADRVPVPQRKLAVDYIRDTYLAKLGSDELEMLFSIAEMAAFETPASIESLGPGNIESLLESEIVFETTHGRTKVRKRLQLPHHKLGELILDTPDEYKRKERLLKIVDLDVFQACFLARRLQEEGEEAQPKAILAAARSKVTRLDAGYSLGYTGAIASLYKGAIVSDYSEIEPEFRQGFEALHFGGGDFFEGFPTFLDFSKKNLPNLYQDAISRLKGYTTSRAYADEVSDMSARCFTSLLKFAVEHEPSLVPLLASPFKTQSFLQELAVKLINGPWDEAQSFIRISRLPTVMNDEQRRFFDDELKREHRLDGFASHLKSAPMTELISMLKGRELAEMVMSKMDDVSFTSRPWKSDVRMLEWLPKFRLITAEQFLHPLRDEFLRRAGNDPRSIDWQLRRRDGKAQLDQLLEFPNSDTALDWANLGTYLSKSTLLSRIFEYLPWTSSFEVAWKVYKRGGESALRAFMVPTLVQIFEQKIGADFNSNMDEAQSSRRKVIAIVAYEMLNLGGHDSASSEDMMAVIDIDVSALKALERSISSLAARTPSLTDAYDRGVRRLRRLAIKKQRAAS